MLLFAAPTAAAACADADLRPDPTNLERVRAALICLHNDERRASGVAPLRSNGLLESSATAHSSDMVTNRYFAHDSLDGSDPFDRMRRAGYAGRRYTWNAGENIGWGSSSVSTPRAIFDAWMQSTGHRLTLLASDFSELGVGIWLGAPDAEYAHLGSAATYTVDFGWRKARKKKRR